MITKIACGIMAAISIYGAWSNRRDAKKRADFIKENGASDHDLWRYGDFKYSEGINKAAAALFITLEILLWLGWMGVEVVLK